jgi:hypothetical protein
MRGDPNPKALGGAQDYDSRDVDEVVRLDKALLTALQGAAAEGPPVELDPETASAIRRVLGRVPVLEVLLTDFVIDADAGEVSDPCLNCYNYVRRHEGHKPGCPVPAARLLLGRPIPEMELQVLREEEARAAAWRCPHFMECKAPERKGTFPLCDCGQNHVADDCEECN